MGAAVTLAYAMHAVDTQSLASEMLQRLLASSKLLGCRYVQLLQTGIQGCWLQTQQKREIQ